MRYGPPRALLNVIPPLAQNHLHYSSEVWISLSYTLILDAAMLQQNPSGVSFFFFWSWDYTSRDAVFKFSRAAASFSVYAEIQERNMSCRATLSYAAKIWQPFKLPGFGLCLIYRRWDSGEAGCYSWFRAFHLHLTLRCCTVTSSAYVFHSMSHSTCMSPRLLGASKAPNISSTGSNVGRLDLSLLFLYHNYHAAA